MRRWLRWFVHGPKQNAALKHRIVELERRAAILEHAPKSDELIVQLSRKQDELNLMFQSMREMKEKIVAAQRRPVMTRSFQQFRAQMEAD